MEEDIKIKILSWHIKWLHDNWTIFEKNIKMHRLQLVQLVSEKSIHNKRLSPFSVFPHIKKNVEALTRITARKC